jgi:hypothetical protein
MYGKIAHLRDHGVLAMDNRIQLLVVKASAAYLCLDGTSLSVNCCWIWNVDPTMTTMMYLSLRTSHLHPGAIETNET